MAAFTTRFDTPLVDELDRLANKHGLSRNAFLERLAERAVKQGFVPIRPGEGFRGSAPRGGTYSLMQEYRFVSAGQTGLAEEELVVFEQAKEWADASLWHQARLTLTAAGFTVSNVAHKRQNS